MKLFFKQRFFSWLDSYDVYDEQQNAVYTVEGKLSWGHKLVILDAAGGEVGVVQEVPLALLPRFVLSAGGAQFGEIRKEFTFFKPSFQVDCNGWHIQGDFWEWDYRIEDACGRCVASISKELLNWTDTYVIDVAEPQHARMALMVTLALDAAKCSSGNP